ncbi:MAG: glycosyltransferase [Kineosporiaceae bacterium]
MSTTSAASPQLAVTTAPTLTVSPAPAGPQVHEAILREEHRSGRRGTIAFLTSTGKPGRPDVDAALALGAQLVGLGYGVVVRSRHVAPPPDAVAVLVTTPTADPAVVGEGALCAAWIIDGVLPWSRHPALPLFDLVLAGSPMLRARLEARDDVQAPVRVLAPAASVVPDAVAARPSRNRRRLAFVVTRGTAKAASVLPGAPRRIVRALARRVVFRLRLADPVTLIAVGEGATLRKVAKELAKQPFEPRIARHPASITKGLRRMAVGTRSHTPLGVLDPGTTGQVGIVPAGLLDALAAGCLPLVPTRLGLREAGLEALPVYSRLQELRPMLRKLLADPQGVRRQAEQLRAVVAARHTWAHRAADLAAVLEEVGPASTPPVLGFLPDFRVTNPFQDMLNADLSRRGWRVAPVRNLLQHPLPRDPGADARLDHHVLHVHWTNPVVQVAGDAQEAQTRLDTFRAHVLGLKARGCKVLWTVHNVLPHESHHLEQELALCRFLAEHADLVHVMGEATFDAVQPHYTLDPARAVTIPHSSYEGVYPDFITREVARERLGLGPDDVVLLSLGGVRPYRGLGRLLDIFDELSARDPRLRLIVAGKPSIHGDVETLMDRCTAHPRIVAMFEHVPEADLQLYNRAADIAVLPYKAILNSGAFTLAETFGLAVVAPAAGNLLAAAGREHVHEFDPEDDASLRAAIADAIETAEDTERALRTTRSAREAALGYRPEDMARDFADAVEKLTGVSGRRGAVGAAGAAHAPSPSVTTR